MNHDRYVFSDSNISVQDVLDTWLSWKWDYDTSGSLVLQPSLMVTTPHWSPPESGWFKLNTNGAMSLTNQQVAIGSAFRYSYVN
ncbi:hypothetical protein PVK06_022100 [Gossypium arboreum]|uniref:Uncharacterized protein n=1 Tax=Gossypium arboreum TaxID=29729 RepID=A0ABR0P7H4_GOSAR|nr:hypothetical protein PVK06_022100 [Gossypium arboreum]